MKVRSVLYSINYCKYTFVSFPITVYSDLYKLEELHDIDMLTGLDQSQEEQARQLVERNPDLIRDIEEEEARRPSAQNKGIWDWIKDRVLKPLCRKVTFDLVDKCKRH